MKLLRKEILSKSKIKKHDFFLSKTHQHQQVEIELLFHLSILYQKSNSQRRQFFAC